MKYEHFFISNKDDKSNCVIRSFCKLYNKDYDETYTELCNIQKELNCESYNDIEVFETFMKRNNTNKIEYGKDRKIKDLELDNNSYIIFCWDKKDIYHMVTVINNILYDKDDKSFDLYVIDIYKKDVIK